MRQASGWLSFSDPVPASFPDAGSTGTLLIVALVTLCAVRKFGFSAMRIVGALLLLLRPLRRPHEQAA